MINVSRVSIIINETCRFWHLNLAEHLRRVGHSVSFSYAGAAPDVAGLGLLRQFEAIVSPRSCRADGAGAAVHARPAGSSLADPSPADLVVDLTGGALGAPGQNRLVPLYDGQPGEAAAIQAVLDGRAPLISIAAARPSAADWLIIGEAHPALERANAFTASFDTVLEATRALIERSIARLRAGAVGRQSPLPASPGTRTFPPGPAGFLARSLGARISRQLQRLTAHPDHWRIAYRRTTSSIRDTLAWPAEPYRDLADDARRYYADPFLFVQAGRTFLFCEEYPYATGRGIISVSEIGADGVAGRPRPVLEAPYHLSYPHVFARDGQIWMIPETYQARRIELWRADKFPDVWTLDRVLVPDVLASDATLVEHGNRLWIFATLADRGSSWDELAIWSADHLFGPWSPHPGNPVLVDSRAARPAGKMFHREGMLWRPVQDCSRGYGSGLALARIDRLDETSFAQTVMAELAPLPAWRAKGTHTLNVAGGYEAIDILGSRRKW